MQYLVTKLSFLLSDLFSDENGGMGGGGWGVVELVHFNKHFIKNIRKRGTPGNYFEVFLSYNLKTIF